MAEEMVAESQNGGEGMAVERHELEHPWSFWFNNPSAKMRSAAWESSLRKSCTFCTVAEFRQFYNNLFVPSKLPPNADFLLFKEGIEPKWEDPSCAHGGKWTVTNIKGKAALDQIWLNTLLAMIGKQFDEGDDICGVVVSVRPRGDRIAIWTRSASNEATQVSIGRQWKEFIDSSKRIGYTCFEDLKKERTPKNKYTV